MTLNLHAYYKLRADEERSRATGALNGQDRAAHITIALEFERRALLAAHRAPAGVDP